MRLYHDELKTTCEIADGLAGERQAKVMADSGWSKTIPADHQDPALAADQPDVVYQPVTPAKPARGKAKSDTD